MKGLLLKDWRTMAMYGKTFVLMVAMVAGFSYFMNGGTFGPTMLMMYLILMSQTLYQADETAKWDCYAVSSPVARRTIVASRYLFLLLLMLPVMALGFAINAAVAIIKGETGWLGPLAGTVGIMALMFLLCTALMAPVFYKFGAEKARLAALFIFLVPFLGTVWLMQYIEPFLQGLAALPTALLAAGAALLGIAIYLVSWLVSSRLYAAREF